MRIVIFGLSITSSWGNGHATTYRALLQALKKRGHSIIFYERNAPWYAANRDLPEPRYCAVKLFDEWNSVRGNVVRELRNCDVAIVGSYFPDGIQAINEVLQAPVVKVFYDIDTPITLSQLRMSGRTAYISREQVSGFDLYLSFTGGPLLTELEERFDAKKALPLFCSFDPDQYRTRSVRKRYESDFSYMGTYAADRQPKIEELFCVPARSLPKEKFLLAGPQYPKHLRWPANVRRIVHVNPNRHAAFYSSSRLTLNVTRDDMVRAGYSPSVRIFEAAACGTAIVSDYWAGLESFLTPNEEVLIAETADDVVRYIRELPKSDVRRIGERARERVLAEHSSQQRAEQFEDYISRARQAIPQRGAASRRLPVAAAV